MENKEYTSPRVIVTEADCTFNLLQGSGGTTTSLGTTDDYADDKIRSKGTDIWDEDEGDDFGW
ncbi:MAG: hypothetical protein LUC26_05590 [Prevotella sp.]|nr:hypothetical protein [Prevotella sp.]